MMYGLNNIDFGAIERHTMPSSLEDEAQKALQLASWSARTVVVLQTIAAGAALGLFIIQYMTYKDNKKTRSRRSKR